MLWPHLSPFDTQDALLQHYSRLIYRILNCCYLLSKVIEHHQFNRFHVCVDLQTGHVCQVTIDEGAHAPWYVRSMMTVAPKLTLDLEPIVFL